MSDEPDVAVLSRVGIGRRAFLKRLVAGAAFAVPSIQSFDLKGASAETCGGNPTSARLLTSTPNPSTEGQAVTLTGYVRIQDSGNSGPGAGNVEFFDGVTSLGVAAMDPTIVSSNGTGAQLVTTALTLGEHTLTFTYLGFDDCPSSTSREFTHTVIAATYPLPVGQPPALAPSGGQPLAGPNNPDLDTVSDGVDGNTLAAAVIGTAGLAAGALAYRRSHPGPKDA